MREEKLPITFIFLGDIMIGRLMNEVIDEHGPAWIWGDTLDELHQTDLLLINLETTLTRHNKKLYPKVFNYKSDPKNIRPVINHRMSKSSK